MAYFSLILSDINLLKNVQYTVYIDKRKPFTNASSSIMFSQHQSLLHEKIYELIL